MRILSALLLSIFIFPQAAFTQKVVKTGTGFAMTKTMELKDLKETAGIIFKGSFEDYKEEEYNGYNTRLLKFKVKEAIRGVDSNKKALILREWARIHSVFDNTLIASDQDYIFFFYEPSDKGFTSLVGMEQGMVAVDSKSKLHFSKRLKNNKVRRKLLYFFTQEQNIESYQDIINYLKA